MRRVFTHWLTRQVAYEAQLVADRRALHAVTAEALEGASGAAPALSDDALRESVLREALYRANEGPVVEIGAHYEAAGRSRRAGLYHLSAAKASDRQSLFAAARGCFTRSLEIRRRIGDVRGQGATMNNFGNLLVMAGEYEQAMRLFESALALRRSNGDRWAEGGSLVGIGSLYDAVGRLSEAVDYLKRGMAICESVGDELTACRPRPYRAGAIAARVPQAGLRSLR